MQRGTAEARILLQRLSPTGEAIGGETEVTVRVGERGRPGGSYTGQQLIDEAIRIANRWLIEHAPHYPLFTTDLLATLVAVFWN
jgi:hypothetical protein